MEPRTNPRGRKPKKRAKPSKLAIHSPALVPCEAPLIRRLGGEDTELHGIFDIDEGKKCGSLVDSTSPKIACTGGFWSCDGKVQLTKDHKLRYTCEQSQFLLRSAFYDRFRSTAQGCFVNMCDSCAEIHHDIIPEKQLNVVWSFDHRLDGYDGMESSQRIVLKKYEECECAKEFNDVFREELCYKCASTILASDHDAVRKESFRHQPCPDGRWMCICKEVFNSPKDGREKMMAKICLGCRQFKLCPNISIPADYSKFETISSSDDADDSQSSASFEGNEADNNQQRSHSILGNARTNARSRSIHSRKSALHVGERDSIFRDARKDARSAPINTAELTQSQLDIIAGGSRVRKRAWSTSRVRRNRF